MKRSILIILFPCLFILNPVHTQSILSFGDINSINGDTVDIAIMFENNSNYSLAGFQFDLENGRIDSVYGGDVQANGWNHPSFNPNFSATSSRILGYAFGTPNIPASTSPLLMLRFTVINTNLDFCLTNIVMSDPSANSIPTSAGPCLSLSTVNIYEKSFFNSISAYPNPTYDFITIDLKSTLNSVTVSLKDINGRLLSNKTYTSTSIINYEIEVPKGLYLLEITNNNGGNSLLKVIKQ